MVPYLLGVGYAPGQAGAIVGAAFTLSIVGQPLLGSIADRVESPRRLIASLLMTAGIAIVFVPAVSTVAALLVALVLVYSLTANSLPAVLDGWIMARRELNPRINYGVARGFGSAGFALGAWALGHATNRFGLAIVFPAYLVIVAGAALMVIRTRPAPRATQDDAVAHVAVDTVDGGGLGRTLSDGASTPDPQPTAPATGRVRALVANRPYLYLLLAAFLAFAGLRASSTFLPLLISELGGTLADVGAAYSLAALSEIPILFMSTLILRRVRGPRFIAVVLVVLAARLFGYTLLASPRAVLALQLTHGITFGLFLAASVDYIHSIAPPDQRGFFQAVAPSVYFGLGGITGSALGGILVEATSIRTLLYASALSALSGALVLAFGTRTRARPVSG